jgi:hypothetical protein
MGNPTSLFYGQSNISMLWAIQYLYAMGNPIYLFYGQSNISILWAIQYLYFMGNLISLCYYYKSWKLYIIFLSTKQSDMKNGLLFVQPSSWLSFVGINRSGIPWPALFHHLNVTKLKVKPYMIHMFAFLLIMLKVD